MALTKDDLTQIQVVIDSSIKNAFKSFWDEVLEPVVNNIYERFDEIDKRFNKVDKRFDEIDEKLKDHDLRFDSVDRKLNAEIKYRDELEVRVKTLEKHH